MSDIEGLYFTRNKGMTFQRATVGAMGIAAELWDLTDQGRDEFILRAAVVIQSALDAAIAAERERLDAIRAIMDKWASNDDDAPTNNNALVAIADVLKG